VSRNGSADRPWHAGKCASRARAAFSGNAAGVGPVTLLGIACGSLLGTRKRNFWTRTGSPRLLPAGMAMAPHSPHSCASVEQVMCGPNDSSQGAARPAGAIRETADGRLEALKRVYIPTDHGMRPANYVLWGTVIADVATTYGHKPDATTRTSRARFRSVQLLNDRVLGERVGREFRKVSQPRGPGIPRASGRLVDRARGQAERE